MPDAAAMRKTNRYSNI